MENHNKIKLWEDLSSKEQEAYIRKVDEISAYTTLSYMYALYPKAKNREEIQDEMKKRLMRLENLDKSILRKFEKGKKEKQAKELYYSGLEKSAIELFYNFHFDAVVSATNFNSEIRLLLIKGEVKYGKNNLKLIGYIEERIKEYKFIILEKYTWGVDWYGLEMPGSDKKDILYQWFDLNHIEKFDSFVRDLVMIEELKDCINELSYPISEKKMHNDYFSINQRKNEKDIESIKKQIIEWIYGCLALYVAEMDIVYFKQALFRFLDEGKDVEAKEIHVKKQTLKSADLNSFIWVIWYYWNLIKAIKQETIVVFVKKFFKNIYKDYQEKGHPVIPNETIISHLRENVGRKIKIPETLQKRTKKTK